MKVNIKITACIAGILIFTSFSCQSQKIDEIDEQTEPAEENFTEPYEIPETLPDAFAFDEVWGYIMEGREYEFSKKFPITDVGYFVSAVNTYSELNSVPPKNKFFSKYDGRVHLVTSVDSRSQTHLLLDPELPLRNRIIKQLIDASKTYDGLQIDWELVPARDREHFISFLKEIKKRLKGKTLSVALPARVKKLKEDAYPYEEISMIVDKIIIMAYDEHWSTSAPGAIASTNWCKRIAEYAQTQIPEEKLVMGISFYGRTWTNDSIGGRAWYNSGINRILRENNVDNIERDEYGVPHFTFEHTVKITGWYDDVESLKIRCQMYSDIQVKQIGFWRIGQEDHNFWQHIRTK